METDKRTPVDYYCYNIYYLFLCQTGYLSGDQVASSPPRDLR